MSETSQNDNQFKSNNSDFFVVTPEIVEETKTVKNKENKLKEEDITRFRQNAINDGFTTTVINKATGLIDETITSYEQLEGLLEKAIQQLEDEKRSKEVKEANIKKAVQLDIEKLYKITDIASYSDELIRTTYHTTAVTSMDLIKSATDEELNLDLYQEPIFSIILQMDKQWVSDKIQSILKSWEEKEYPKIFVEKYLKLIGVEEKDFEQNKKDLIKFLPVIMQEEKSPDIYKQFKAVQFIQQQKDSSDSIDLSQKIFSNTVRLIEYDATLQNEIEDGMPSLAASAKATEAAMEIEEQEDATNGTEEDVEIYNENVQHKKKGLVGKAGSICGKVVSLKYNTAKNFDDMMKESMGEYGEVWEANREAARIRKNELKQKKLELKHEASLHKQEIKAAAKNERVEIKETAKHQQREYNNNQRANNYNNTSYYNNYNTGYNTGYNSRTSMFQNGNGNFAPKIPLPLIIAAVNTIIALIIALIFGKSTAVFSCIGLVIAVFGFIKQKLNESGYLIVIIGGYALTLVAVLLAIL